MSNDSRRVLVIGLDCAEPSLMLERWRADLPHLNRLMSSGAYGRLESCHPPITVPAWASMLASRDPGQLGYYGFRNRADYSYGKLSIANGTAVKAPRVWDILSDAGKQSVVVGVPQTYPVRPINGNLISCFLTPPGAAQWTYPDSLAGEVTALLDGEPYEFDVKDFRTDDRAWLLDSVYRMTKKRWRVLQELIQTKPWDLFLFVEMGTDRMHHGFWSEMDPRHFRYVPGNPFENAIHDYYVFLDGEIGKLLEKVDDDTFVIVVSDHGAQRMDGGFCVNQWLQQKGLLTVASKPPGIVPLHQCQVDWSRTIAWGDGGYYARIFLNVEGREPQGVVPADDYEATRDRLKAELEATTGPDGKLLGTIVLKPEEVYREVGGIAPDLIVYFGGLYWRSVGSVGHPGIYTYDNDTGPDDANHAQYGLVILYDPKNPMNGYQLSGLQLESIGPTVLSLLDVAIPDSMMGQPIQLPTADAPTIGANGLNGHAPTNGVTDSGYTDEEEDVITKHLAALGYVE